MATPEVPRAASPDSARMRRMLVRTAAVAAFALVFTVGAQLWWNRDNSAAMAVTPALLETQTPPRKAGAAQELRAIARQVEALPTDVGDGPVAEVALSSWSLFTRVDGDQVTSEVVPQDSVITTYPDGTHNVVTSYPYEGEQRQEQSTSSGDAPDPDPPTSTH